MNLYAENLREEEKVNTFSEQEGSKPGNSLKYS